MRRTSITCPVRSDTRTSIEVRATAMEDSSVPGGSAPKARSRIGVWVRSGLTQFTFTPIGDHSSASAWVRLTTAALDEEYRLYPARPRV
jgi:hypothetical protein